MLKYLFLIFIFAATQSNSFAQKNFLKACNLPALQKQSVQNDIKWFKYLYKTTNCNEIVSHLSKLTSLSQILQPWDTSYISNSGDHGFPHEVEDITVRQAFYKWSFNNNVRRDIFKDIKLYSEFKNINYFNYSKVFTLPFRETICSTLKLFPNVKTVSTEFDPLYIQEGADTCLANAGVEVIINDRVETFKPFRFKANIVGMQEYIGDLKELLVYENLKYLGITDKNQGHYGDTITYNTEPKILKTLGGLSNLTHLRLTTSNVHKIEDLKYSYNLTWLKIACFSNEIDLKKSPCNFSTPYLTNLNFITELMWLEHLDVSYNELKTIPDFSQLKRLRSLILRGNSISILPWKKEHPSLAYLDLAGNKLTSLKGLEFLKKMDYLNISSNKIGNFSEISSLPQLQFLNISNNLFQDNLETLNPAPRLKALSLNGGCNVIDADDYYPAQHIVNFDSPDATLYTEQLSGDFWYEDGVLDLPRDDDNGESDMLNKSYWDISKTFRCDGKEFISSKVDFKKFENLEVLTLRYNQLGSVPNLTSLKRLKYLNMEGNKLSEVDLRNLPKSLVVLAAPFNELTIFPTLSSFPLLRKVNLIANNIASIKNMKLPTNSMTINMSGNLIEDLKPIAQPKFKDMPLQMFGNPVKEENCPLKSPNAELNHFCWGLKYGDDSHMDDVDLG